MSPLDMEHAEIRQLITDWRAAVRCRDYDGVLNSHSRNVLMFDVPPPFESEGIDAYRKTRDLFFSWMAGPPKFELSDVRITAGQSVAFVTAHGKCYGPNGHGRIEDLEFRLTLRCSCASPVGHRARTPFGSGGLRGHPSVRGQAFAAGVLPDGDSLLQELEAGDLVVTIDEPGAKRVSAALSAFACW